MHHEDIRRAQPDWAPRDPRRRRREGCSGRWCARPAKGLTRGAPVGVTLENAVTGSRAVLSAGAPSVTVRGLPSEVALFVFGRKAQADVELLGDDATWPVSAGPPSGSDRVGRGS